MRYQLKLVRDDAKQLVYEESANYREALTCIAIGVFLLLLGLLGVRFGLENLAWRKPIATALFGGVCFLLLSAPYFIQSKVIVDGEQLILTVQRRLAGIPWSHAYRFADIESVFEGSTGRKDGKVLLAIELRNARTAKLNLWARATSLSTEEGRINGALKQFEAAHGHQARKPMTEDELWAHTKENASADLKRRIEKTLFALVGSLASSGAASLFLFGHPLHQHWRTGGPISFFIAMIFWLTLILQVAFSLSQWSYVRDLRRIDKDATQSVE